MKKKFIHNIEFQTPASVNKVYDFAKNVEKRSEWISIIQKVELLDSPIKVGSKFKEYTNKGTMILEFTALEPNNKVAYKTIESKGLFADINWDIEETNGGSFVKISFSFQAKGFLKIILPIMFNKIKQGIDNDIRLLEGLLLNN
ncbi:Polyketide cyclase / dehydrase and lipid transport [Mesonia phycicola]|uniref:Polyketide cyclase / dehydrase and lipid transport n=1 Tax=Mesonia phycicola TaxID=579105 RepID=A0A1M6HA89_9FLAO|nr:SRPBCC family protein [Mesonia phycicola]SHJ19076.1 Polyketide cyclase / dehydrase and lipid transport [Mesonia phycicola]